MNIAEAPQCLSKSPVQQYIGFNVNSVEYMVPILDVREIISTPLVTALPDLPSCIRGITNLRGAIVPLLNLNILLNSSVDEESGDTVIVLTTGSTTFGIIVDGITGVIKVQDSEVDRIENIANSEVATVAGIAKLNDNLIILLDTYNLLPRKHLNTLNDITANAVTSTPLTNDGEKDPSLLRRSTDTLQEAREYMKGRFDNNSAHHTFFDLMLDFMDALSKGQFQQIDQLISDLVKTSDNDIFTEVGKITRKIHDSLETFNSDIKDGLQQLTDNDVPQAVDSLHLVISKNELSANRTLSCVERYFQESSDFSRHIDRLQGHDDSKAYLKVFKEALDHNMTEILTAQQYQDITGQTIIRVINLVNSVEAELLKLISRFSMQTGSCSVGTPVDQSNVGTGEKPRESISQSDVESLLNEFGF